VAVPPIGGGQNEDFNASHPHGLRGWPSHPLLKIKNKKKKERKKEEQCFCIFVNLFLHYKPFYVCLSYGIIKMKILMLLQSTFTFFFL
jgi:hypothetical protein